MQFSIRELLIATLAVCFALATYRLGFEGGRQRGRQDIIDFQTNAVYPPDNDRTAFALARGELSITDGITGLDLASYYRVKRKLDERTDREAARY